MATEDEQQGDQENREPPKPSKRPERKPQRASADVTSILERVETLTRENGELKKLVPAKGSKVISEADHAELESYRALGKPDDIKKAVDENATLKTANGRLTRESSLRSACAIQNLNFEALVKLPGMSDLELETKDVERQGKKVKVPMVKPAEDDKEGKPVELRDYVKAKYPEFLEALTVKAETPLPRPGNPTPRKGDDEPRPLADMNGRKPARIRF